MRCSSITQASRAVWNAHRAVPGRRPAPLATTHLLTLPFTAVDAHYVVIFLKNCLRRGRKERVNNKYREPDVGGQMSCPKDTVLAAALIGILCSAGGTKGAMLPAVTLLRGLATCWWSVVSPRMLSWTLYGGRGEALCSRALSLAR